MVVLLDIKLPLLNGIDVLRRMREDERTRRTPVVMLTSSTEQADIAATYGLGANSYVRKPVEFENFVVAARQLGLYWTVLNERPRPLIATPAAAAVLNRAAAIQSRAHGQDRRDRSPR